MSAVFPESMDRLNRQDVSGSLAVIENYIRYMTERVEFSMRNTTRAVGAAGISSAELVLVLEQMQNNISALSSKINEISGAVTSIQGMVEDLQNSTEALEERVTSLEDKEGAENG